jgi:hypothetical protein
MILTTLFLGLSTPALAAPAGHEVQYESSTLISEDGRWDIVGGSTLALGGIRGGWRIAPNTNITAGWRYGGATAGAYTSEGEDIVYEDGDEVYDEEASTEIGMKLHQLSLGSKYSWVAKHWLQPYGAGEAILNIGQLQLDDDSTKEGNANEISHTALAPGGALLLGVDILPFGENARVRAAIFLEAGYQLSLDLDFVDDSTKQEISLGQLPIGGVVTRAGVGLRF